MVVMKKPPKKKAENTSKTIRHGRKKDGRLEMTLGKWTLLGIVVASIIIVVAAICTLFGDTPVQRAEKELQRLADDYYMLYLYPRLIGTKKTAQEALEIYQETGVPTVFLRQLLYFDEENPKSAEIFENLKCDTNGTGVRYYPVEPYGPTDYMANYIWRCDIEQ